MDSLKKTSVPSVRATKVCVVGAGYVGLTAAVCLAELGHSVVCVESNPQRLAALLRGEVPIHEPGIDELMNRHAGTERLSFTDDVEVAMDDVQVVLLCVGTPPRPDGEPDLRQLGRAAAGVVSAARGDVLLIVKSTVPPGSCEALELLAAGHAREGVNVVVASNPEFLREGQAVWDFFNPDRVVVGIDDPQMQDLVTGLYPAQWPLVLCDRRSAELVKYAANTFLAVKISFANEVAQLCEALGADSQKVLAGVGLDARIGGAFLSPGPGFGGSCLPKDLGGFIAVAQSVGQSAPLARAAQVVNSEALDSILRKLEVALGSLQGKRITILGLAFKPGTGDVRFSPGLGLGEALAQRGVLVRAHDPVAAPVTTSMELVSDPYQAVVGADALVIMTAWPQYRELDHERLREEMKGHVVLDAVNVVGIDEVAHVDFDVYGVGRGLSTDFAPVLWPPLEWMLDSEPHNAAVSR
ncbi:MAG: UDP-glucose/GDP-mannose dehydrogenase family protein [Acidimicrobiaceae bacterium]|nr:UDP-glucose/GDP-mannose dehydrogenase family protein [Acidimicrobiaceae bacterium]